MTLKIYFCILSVMQYSLNEISEDDLRTLKLAVFIMKKKNQIFLLCVVRKKKKCG